MPIPVYQLKQMVNVERLPGRLQAVNDDTLPPFFFVQTGGDLFPHVNMAKLVDPVTGLIDPIVIAAFGVIDFVIDGGGSEVATGPRPAFRVPFSIAVDSWAVQGDQAGTCTIDVLVAPDAATPMYASAVGSGTKPNVAGTVATVETAPEGWPEVVGDEIVPACVIDVPHVHVPAGSWIQFDVTEATSFTWLVVSLKVRRC